MVDRLRRDLNGLATVDQVPTCAAGISSLLRRRYHWTFVEHVLHDGSGLDVLRQARRRGTETVVCARTCSMSAAFDAGRLGARAVLLIPEQIRQLTRLLVMATEGCDRRGPFRERLQLLLEQLGASDADRSHHLEVALRAAADDGEALGYFRRVVTALRSAIGSWTPETIDALEGALLSSDDSAPPRVQLVLTVIAASSLSGSGALADACGMTRRSLGHVLSLYTGKSVRHWMRLARLRRALIEMAAGESSVGVCAYHAGYPHPQQLTRDCECELGLAPKQVMALLQDK